MSGMSAMDGSDATSSSSSSAHHHHELSYGHTGAAAGAVTPITSLASTFFDAPVRITPWKQFKLLFWKNWVRKKRAPCDLICEFMCPLVFLLILVILRQSWSKTHVDEQLYTQGDTIANRGDWLISSAACACNSGTWGGPFGQQTNYQMVVFTTASTDQASQTFTTGLMNYVRQTLTPQASTQPNICGCGTERDTTELQFVTDTSTQGGMLQDWGNIGEQGLNTYISQDNYGFDGNIRGVYQAFVLKQLGTAANNWQWSYSLRSNATNLPDTGTTVDPTMYTSNSQWQSDFFQSGLLQLQLYIDQYIISQSDQQSSAVVDTKDDVDVPSSSLTSSKYLNGSQLLQEVTIYQMPDYKHTIDTFAQSLSNVLGIFLLLSLLWPFSRLIKQIVDEKEKKIKEGLAMIGASSTVYMASWLVMYAIGFAILVLFICAIVRLSIFPNSDLSLIFVFFYLFVMSLIALAILLSSVFDSAKLAGLLSPLLALVAIFPLFAVSDPSVSNGKKQAVCILSSSAFGLGITKIADLEAAGGGAQWSNISDSTSNFAMSTALLWILFDTFLILLVAWYLDKVLPKQFGTHQPWYFFATSKYWCTDTKRNLDELNVPLQEVNGGEVDDVVRHIEAVSPSIMSKIGIRIRHLTKYFLTDQTTLWSRLCGSEKEQKRFTAVNKLDLDLHIGQLFVLLGHNGAGKTTTINMLTGMYPPSSGTANVFGLDIRSDMNRIRQNLGVCPQHSVVWDELTVEEHLLLFGGLKGLEGPSLQNAVNIAIAEVTLEEKRHQPSKSLSGGQNRRLCLAMALIGDSKVVFLDEPTSGVDPHSRRAIWNLLHQKKHDRIIILTTHFMDEADELADRIAILSKGKIKCCGSSMFLKKSFGVGYSMTLTKASARDQQERKDDSSSSNSSSSSSSSSTSSNKVKWDPSALTKLIKSHVSNAEKLSQSAGELCYRLPLGSGSSLPDLLTHLDQNKSKLGLSSYGLSVTTLEDVFLKVAQEDEGHGPTSSPSPPPPSHALGVNSPATGTDGEKASLLSSASYEQPLTSSSDDASALMATLVASKNDTTVYRQFLALLRKRSLITRRDKRALCCQIILPIIVLALGLLALSANNGSMSPLTLDMSQYDSPNRIYMNQDNINPYFTSSLTSNPNEGVSQLISAQNIHDYQQTILNDRNQYRETHYGAFWTDSSSTQAPSTYGVMVNITAIFGVPSFMNEGNRAILRGVTQNQKSSIQLMYDPFSTTFSEKQAKLAGNGLLTSLFVTLAFSFVPASFCVFIVLERETASKHLQMISGVGIFSYWLSNFIWDLIMFTIPMTVCVLILVANGNANFTGENAPVVLLSLILYGFSVIPFTYLCSFAFKTHLTAQNVMIIIYILGGMGMVLVGFMLYVIIPQKGKIVRHFFRLLPPFCVGDSLFYLNIRQLGIFQAGRWDMDMTGYDLLYMAIESIVYFILVLVLEYSTGSGGIADLLEKCRLPESAKAMLQYQGGMEEDSDVRAEREWMENPSTDNKALIQLHGLRKVYPGKVAVQNLHFSVAAGEIFGFLGQNGAGKSTTLKMLTGDTQPTSGRALLHGYDLGTDAHNIRQYLGYCPQFDALHLNLSGQETLEFYARIRGIPEKNLATMVNYLIDRLGFRVSAQQPVQGYSGGTKRKVSVGVALIGSPPIVFLDEPSTGMDPMSRRFLWNFISETMAERAVILTTHSMEEAEALSNRIGILNAGALQCLGTSQHLKSKFGRGFLIDLRCTINRSDEVLAFLHSSFPNSKEVENFEGHIKLQTNPVNSKVTLAEIFTLIEVNKQRLDIVDYSVGQISLEDIFLRIAASGDDTVHAPVVPPAGSQFVIPIYQQQQQQQGQYHQPPPPQQQQQQQPPYQQQQYQQYQH